MLKTLNLQRNITAYLENAYGIGYERINNQIWKASFSLPLNDPKVIKVESLKYVEIFDDDKEIGLFRIIPKRTVKSSSTQEVTFQCEHVLATLLGSTLFKDHQLTNLSTRQVLQYLIDQQKEKHWRLGAVEITRYFHYLWENENLLSSIFSVPKPFDEPYRWTFDTNSYPWTLNLVRPQTEPVCRIKEGHNLIGLEIEENPMSVFNRIYPLGYGEGVNQLTIESVNNGVPYLEDADSIAENGIIETVWVDKRFDDPSSLKASTEGLLKKWKEPIVSWNVSAADVSRITGSKIDELIEGNVVRLETDQFPSLDMLIMKESKGDTLGDPGNVQLEIGSISEDLSTTNADLERRQQINELYAQGATNIDSHGYNDNCDPDHPAIIRFYLDEGLVNINTMSLTYETEAFRAYSRATLGGGQVVKSTSSGGGTSTSTASGGGSSQTSSSGGGSTQTSSSGGGVSKSTQSGGGSAQTSSAGGDHNHKLFVNRSFALPIVGEQAFAFRLEGGGSVGVSIPVEQIVSDDVVTETSSGNHNHSVSIPSHSHEFTTPDHNHSVSIPNHAHTVNIPAHTHGFTIPNHDHEITLPDHTHDIEHGIYSLGTMPSEVEIRVDGNLVPVNGLSGSDIDLIPYLEKDGEGKVTRGTWHEVSITPNDLGRINANIISRLFIQSRNGGTF